MPPPLGVPFLVNVLFILHLCFVGQAGAQAPPAVPASTPSSFRLVGTVESKTLSGAVLVDPTGLQSFYHLQEKLPDESRIIRVRSDSILLKRTDGALYELFITQDSKAAVPASLPPDIRPASRAEDIPKAAADQRKRHPRRTERLRKPGLEE